MGHEPSEHQVDYTEGVDDRLEIGLGEAVRECLLDDGFTLDGLHRELSASLWVKEAAAWPDVSNMDNWNGMGSPESQELGDLGGRRFVAGERQCAVSAVLLLGIDDDDGGVAHQRWLRRQPGPGTQGERCGCVLHNHSISAISADHQSRKRLSSFNMRQVVVSLVPDSGSLFEIATPAGVWGSDRAGSVDLAVDFVPCGLDDTTVQVGEGVSMSGLGLLTEHLDRADMVIVPTWPVGERLVPAELTDALIHAHQGGARLVGLCLGAFAIAATGLLDGSSAVTHWRHRDRFEADFPEVKFEPDTLYVDHDSIVTSAGSAAAVDCCLHLVRRDHGAETAARLARSMVTAPHRSGTQSQFAAAPPIDAGPDSFGMALSEAAENIADVNDVHDLVRLTNTSRRTLERNMRDRVGLTPKEWIDEQRVVTACRLLEQPNRSVEEVAWEAGYGSPLSLRRALRKYRGTTPTHYREMFQQ